MSTRHRLAAVAVTWSSSACGDVKDPPADVAMREVSCNGTAVDVLRNGNFDADEPAWRQEPPTPSLLCTTDVIMPDSPPRVACLGGSAEKRTQTLSRDVPLPAGAAMVRLTGRVCIATEETDQLDNDVMTFELFDGAQLISAIGKRSNQQGAAACTFGDFILEAPVTADPFFATFRIQASTDQGKVTTFYVDSLAMTVSCR